MVILSNTIIDPLAVVVELAYASVANVAVTGVAGVRSLTIWTKTIWITFFYQLHKVQVWCWKYMAWVGKSSSKKANIDEGEEKVDDQYPP